MREILFRGKRVDNGEWVYGGYAHIYSNPNTDIIVTGRMCLYEDSGELTMEARNIDPSTVGQFTGLTDKNGKKIFEGDILATPDYPNLKYKVSFANANFCVKCPAQPYLFYLGNRCFDMFGNPEYEIVGNIHDNPELLEVTE